MKKFTGRNETCKFLQIALRVAQIEIRLAGSNLSSLQLLEPSSIPERLHHSFKDSMDEIGKYPVCNISKLQNQLSLYSYRTNKIPIDAT